MNTQQVRVAIIEDDPSTRVGLSQIVDDAEHMSVSVATASVEDFIKWREHRPDVVLLDLWLRGGGKQGADAVKDLVSRGHQVLVLSMSEEQYPVINAVEAGAHGYLTKEAEPGEILRAIGAVSRRQIYYSPTVAGYMLREHPKLTPREQDVLRLVASGETTADIAEQLCISPATVNGHLDGIRAKCGKRRRAGLAMWAVQLGLFPPFSPRRH